MYKSPVRRSKLRESKRLKSLVKEINFPVKSPVRKQNSLKTKKIYSVKEQFPPLVNVYYPLANGGRPFRVTLKNNIAYIDKDKRWEMENENYDVWNELPLWNQIIEVPYIQSFVGKEDPKNPPPCVSDVGSSVLLQISPAKYIYVGVGINELKFREKVKDFVTETGCVNTVDSYIYTSKHVIDPLFGIKYPINGIIRHLQDISDEEYKKCEKNKVEVKVLHKFVL